MRYPIFSQRLSAIVLWLAVATITSCSKYKDTHHLANPTYLRIFNDISEDLNASKINQPIPFLTVLYDPTFDADGVPVGGTVVGDYLQARQTFSLSYPLNAANAGKQVVNSYTQNFDIPGSLPLLPAPSMNGLDISAWGQFPSGTHRILFVSRPLSDTPFAKLPATIRKNILIDTMLSFAPSEVYTMEVITRDIDQAKYGVYVRHENFVHQAFNPNKIYLSFYKLSAKHSAIRDPYNPYVDFFPDTVVVSYKYWKYYYSASGSGYVALPGMNQQYLTTLSGNFQKSSLYLEVPLLDVSNFVDYSGIIETYGDNSVNPLFNGGRNLYRSGQGGDTKFGTFPYIELDFSGLGQLSGPFFNLNQVRYTISCMASPNTINQIPAEKAMTTANNFTFPNLNIITPSHSGGATVSRAVNIVELVNDKVYLMQIQPYFP